MMDSINAIDAGMPHTAPSDSMVWLSFDNDESAGQADSDSSLLQGVE
jgi:hypothetical protein